MPVLKVRTRRKRFRRKGGGGNLPAITVNGGTFTLANGPQPLPALTLNAATMNTGTRLTTSSAADGWMAAAIRSTAAAMKCACAPCPQHCPSPWRKAPLTTTADNGFSSLSGTFTSAGTLPAGWIVDCRYNGLKQIALVLSPYQAWASVNGLSGSNALPGADPDRDGAPKGIEFVMGTRPIPAPRCPLWTWMPRMSFSPGGARMRPRPR